MTETHLLEQFLVSLQTINRHMRRGGYCVCGDRRITRVQWMILRHIQRSERCTIGQLAEQLHVRPSTMSQMLDRLEKERLLFRETDPLDTRSKRVRLTEEGEALIREVEALWMKRLAKPFARLSHGEQESLLALLGKFAHFIQQDGKD